MKQVIFTVFQFLAGRVANKESVTGVAGVVATILMALNIDAATAEQAGVISATVITGLISIYQLLRRERVSIGE